ncbi:MAG: MotA/TolQ/ExbB proton channel family protein [Candidatus Latescibacterota bacterium]|nr:MotA/TolQ/ExbB proton channel family protein [Candidatus Latescibacterota bacterium]
MNALSIIVGILFALACGATGGVLFLHRARRVHQEEAHYNLHTPHLPRVATAVGVLTGVVIGFLALYFASYSRGFDLVAWIGRASYLLVAGSVGVQLLTLGRIYVLLLREEDGWGRKPQKGTLGVKRLERWRQLRQQYRHDVDLRAHDDDVLAELSGVLGTPLLNARRDQSRIPFYGYLGTVCGILLMARELGGITEATETFLVLQSMAVGLVLAFQTTLVALVAFLPLRKVADVLAQRLDRLEERWLRLRDEDTTRN